MIFAPIVLPTAKQVSLPVEFIELTRIADELSRVTGKVYKIDPSLSRETVYLSTKDWSVENVSKRVANAFRAEWQQDGETFTFRRNSKVLAKLREEEESLMLERIQEQKRLRLDPIAQKLVGDTLPYRLELAKKRDAMRRALGESEETTQELNELDQQSFQLIPEFLALRDSLNQMPRSWWSRSEPSQTTHYANIYHALALPMNSSASIEKYVVDQSNRDAQYLAQQTPEQRSKLEHYLNVSLSRKPITGKPLLWTKVSAQHATQWAVSTTCYDAGLDFASQTWFRLDIAKKRPVPKDIVPEEMLVKRVDDPVYIREYLGTAPHERTDLEPAQLALGAAFRELAKVYPEMVAIVPDGVIPFFFLTQLRFRYPFRTLKEALDGLSDTMTWDITKPGEMVARPEFMLRHEKFRSNHKVTRQLFRQLRQGAYLTFADGLTYASSQPEVAFNGYAYSLEEAYDLGHLDGTPRVYDGSMARTFRFLGALDTRQREALLNGGTLTGRQLSPLARKHLIDASDGSTIQFGEFTKSGKPVVFKNFLDAMAFSDGLSHNTLIQCSVEKRPSVIMRPGKNGIHGIQDLNSVAVYQFMASEGTIETTYPKFQTVTYQPITLHSLQIKIREGQSSASLFASFTDGPGVLVKSISELPPPFRDPIAIRVGQLKNNTNRIGKPPPL